MDGLRLEKKLIFCGCEAMDSEVFRHVSLIICKENWATLDVVAGYLRSDIHKWPHFFSLNALQECFFFLKLEDSVSSRDDFVEKLISEMKLRVADGRRRCHKKSRYDIV